MLKKFIINITKSKENIFKGGIILFLGMNLVNVGNYLFNMLMGRMLGPADYGSLVSLISFFAIMSVPATTIQTSSMKFSSQFIAQNKPEKISYLIKYLTKKVFYFGIILAVILIILSSYISHFLNISSNLPLVILIFSFIFLFLLPINRGVLQGIQNFRGLLINMTIEPFLKIFFAIILIFFGYKLLGVTFGMLITALIIYLASFLHLKSVTNNKPTSFDTKSFWQYSLPTLLGIFLISFITYADVIAVKHYLSPDEAGLYSALSTISKIVLFFSFPFISAMFPKISNLYTLKEKHFPILAQTFLIVSILSLSVMGFFMLFPQFSVGLLFGKAFLPISPYLGQLSFAMFLLALINLFINYFLAIGQTKFLYGFTLFVILEIVLIYYRHANYNDIINNMIISFGGLLIFLAGLYIYSKKEQLIYAINNNSRV
jgi:O-antigen/teichoic acid export membrane protein